MPRQERIVAMITLSLLNVLVVAAALAVVKLTPKRSLVPAPPTVAARLLVPGRGVALAGARAPAPLPSTAQLAARLAATMRGAGAAMSGTVIDASTRRTLFSSRADTPAVPASTTKVTTSVAALAAAGPDHRLTTKVVQGGGGVVLVGGGDPTLTTFNPRGAYPRRASLTDLARQTAAALRAAGTTRVRVDYDASLYQGRRIGPGWKPNYLPDGEVAPVSALALDEGRVAPGAHQRAADPPRAATAAFARVLARNGVIARVGVRTTAPRGARQLGAVQSPPVSALVESALTHSDNDIAEALARLTAITKGRPATFEGGAQAVHEVLAGLGVGNGVGTVDGSGLSPLNRITPNALAKIAAVAASGRHPELRAAVTGMPIAGFSGTLANRYGLGLATMGRGVVRAKTGTLNGVNTLAGVVETADGRLLAFAFMANKVRSPAAALAALDGLAGTLAGCGCR